MTRPARPARVACLLLLTLVAAAPALVVASPPELGRKGSGAATYTTPKPGSKERKAILDPLRVPVSRDFRRPMVFVVNTLRVKDGWAFLEGKAVRKDGKPIDYKGTAFEEAKEHGAFDGNTVVALLRQKKGRWTVVEYAVGPTDVPWDGWDRRRGCPRAILPYPEG